jgi:hypothetical protein
MLLTYFLNDFEMVPVAPIITGITLVFTFHMRCITILLLLLLTAIEFSPGGSSSYTIIIIIIIIKLKLFCPYFRKILEYQIS